MHVVVFLNFLLTKVNSFSIKKELYIKIYLLANKENTVCVL